MNKKNVINLQYYYERKKVLFSFTKVMSLLNRVFVWTAVGARIPYFLQSLVTLQSLWRTKTVLFEPELIINNAPLTYAYTNTIETWHTIIFYLAGSYYILLKQPQL